MQDLYSILGLTSDATKGQIHKAYRKLVSKCHPDIYPNDPEKLKQFQAITEAHEVLMDEDNRTAYDKTGEINNSAKMNKNIRAKTILSMVFISVVAQIPEEYDDADPIELSRKYLTDKFNEIKGEVPKLDDEYNKLKRAAKRIKSKKEDNVLLGALNSRLEAIKDSKKKAAAELEALSLAIEMLEDYYYEMQRTRVILDLRNTTNATFTSTSTYNVRLK